VLIGVRISALLREGEDLPLKGDTHFRWLTGAAAPLYLASMYVPFSASFFLLEPLSVVQLAADARRGDPSRGLDVAERPLADQMSSFLGVFLYGGP
jgi:hypothetical protein